MRKRIFLTLVLSLCVAEFGANAAVAQRGTNARGANNNQNVATEEVKNAPVSARAGNRQQVGSNVKSAEQFSTGGNVSARAGKKQQQVNSTVKARAGATQKVINTGTKVASATENTAVPEECQNAFYGCMDAFCMLDNASGGRCQCSDRITELDKVLEDILKLDEQSYIMATEGVERIQMGEAEEEIMKRAKAAGEKAVNGPNSEDNKKKARTLDLSVFDNNIFNDDDDVFSFEETKNSLLEKKGDALLRETTKMCAGQIPNQCRTYGSMLSLVYAQKVKSDCIAYENSLKAQKNQSQQKLQTAQKALREAALDEYKNQNKYATTGECVIEFTKCMKTTAECGDDYTGCVTLAAAENVKKGTKSGSVAKQTKIKGSVKGVDISLAASTMESLLAKKVICEHVTKQCVNSNKNDAVWNAFLKNAAPALKSAELIAEQNLRSNCIPTAAECFTNACKSQFGDNDESYDMCLSNPATYKNLCKVQLEPCLEATGGSFDKPEDSSMWNGLVAMLGAMKVDACTKEVKDCLLSEDRCGADYAGCIGLDTATIGDLCPDEKLTACMTNYDKDTVKTYVAQVAQGLALQIDNSLATVCQNAADEAMIKACGDTESCEGANFDLFTLEANMKVRACTNGKETKNGCYDSLAMIDAGADIAQKGAKYRQLNLGAVLINAPDVSYITFKDGKFSATKIGNTNEVKSILDAALNRIMNQINSDPKVVYCREGREVQGFSKQKFGSVSKNTKNTGKTVQGLGEIGKKKISSRQDFQAVGGVNNNDNNDNNGDNGQGARFPNLTDSYASVVASSLLEKLSEKNAELTSKFTQQLAELNNQITETIYAGDELAIDTANEKNCRTKLGQNEQYEEHIKEKENNCGHKLLSWDRLMTWNIGTYDPETNVCTVKMKKWQCEDWHKPVFCDNYCQKYDNGTVLSSKKIQMAKSH